MNYSEQYLGKGLKPDPEDNRDYIYKPLGGELGAVMTAEEWEKGYDIEKELGIKIKPKNQFNSLSCVGQGSSSLSAVMDFIETKTWDEHSAKAIYSQIALANGGAYLRDAMKLLKEWGELYESQLKSYKEDGTTDEQFMRDLSWKTDAMSELAKTLQAKDYKRIVEFDIDTFARAIKDGHGVLMGVTGTNNGTWRSTYPVPPTLDTPNADLWGHALYAGKFRIKDGKKQIGVLNSWGDIGEDGWQWLGEEWFADGGRWIINPWVLIDKPNKEYNMEFIENNDLKWVRNMDTGAFGRIIHKELKTFSSQDRAVLALLDDRVRENGVNVNNETWNSLPQSEF